MKALSLNVLVGLGVEIPAQLVGRYHHGGGGGGGGKLSQREMMDGDRCEIGPGSMTNGKLMVKKKNCWEMRKRV